MAQEPRSPPRHVLSGLPGWPFVSAAGGWSMLLDVASLGFEPEEASPILLEDAQIAATGMRSWGDEVAQRYVRFVFSAEPVERLERFRTVSREPGPRRPLPLAPS